MTQSKLQTVSRIVNAADAERVSTIYRRCYSGDDGWGSAATFNEFRERLNASIGVDEGEGMVVRITARKDDEDCDWFDVSGVTPDGACWAIEFRPWGEWKLLPVEAEMPIDDAATHIYYEMTWGGWPEQSEERFADICDAAEEVRRQFDA